MHSRFAELILLVLISVCVAQVRANAGIGTADLPDTIRVAEIEDGLPKSLRPFLTVSALPIDRSNAIVVKAFWEAASRIEGKLILTKRINVFIGVAPFAVRLATGILEFTPRPDIIHVVIEDFVFLDTRKMSAYPFQIQVASILEEFVHSLMNVSDESLAMTIVVSLYPNVRLVNGSYQVAGTDN